MSLADRLIDYFVVLGPTHEQLRRRESGPAGHKGAGAGPGVFPSVLDRIPNYDLKSTPFSSIEQSLQMFLFPKELPLLEEGEAPLPYLAAYVSTTQSYRRFYVVALISYEDPWKARGDDNAFARGGGEGEGVAPGSMPEVTDLHMEKEGEKSPTALSSPRNEEKRVLLAPFAIAIVSRVPFLPIFQNILSSIFRGSGCFSPESLADHLSCSMRFPVADAPHTRVVGGGGLSYQYVSPLCSSQDLRPLLCCLSSDSVFELLGLLLLEERVILTSRVLPELLLVEICEGARSLLYPFDFHHVYAPQIPLKYSGSLRVPAPIFCGVHLRPEEAPPSHIDDVHILDLDTDTWEHVLGTFKHFFVQVLRVYVYLVFVFENSRLMKNAVHLITEDLLNV